MKFKFLTMAVLATAVVFAQGQVETSAPVTMEALMQKVTKLEEMVAKQANFSNQMARLQAEMQMLQSNLDIQNQTIDQLRSVLTQQYQTLATQVTELQKANNVAKAKSTSIITQSADEKQFLAAFKQLSNREYESAINALQKFIKDHPKSEYVASARYWLGEAYVTLNQDDKALKQFTVVVQNYPKSSKADDALLKMAYINDDLGNWTQAKKQLNMIIAHYPKTTSAHYAKIRLEKMAQEGH